MVNHVKNEIWENLDSHFKAFHAISPVEVAIAAIPEGKGWELAKGLCLQKYNDVCKLLMMWELSIYIKSSKVVNSYSEPKKHSKQSSLFCWLLFFGWVFIGGDDQTALYFRLFSRNVASPWMNPVFGGRRLRSRFFVGFPLWFVACSCVCWMSMQNGEFGQKFQKKYQHLQKWNLNISELHTVQVQVCQNICIEIPHKYWRGNISW